METHETNIQHRDSFVELSNESLNEVIKILESRLPRHGHLGLDFIQIYNMALIMTKSHSNIKAFAQNGDLSDKAILVLIVMRKDYGQDINVSIPLDFKANEEIKQAFINTRMINWKKAYWFNTLDRLISPMILEIITVVMKHEIDRTKNYYYFMSRKEATNLFISPELEPDVEVKTLDLELGLDFVINNWKWTRPGSEEYIKEIIEKYPSGGVYIKGTPVSGITMNVDGVMGMLYTADEHRGKGYALLCMKYLMQQMGNNGFIPISTAGQENVAACAFHKKVGLTYSHETDYLMRGDSERL